MARTCSALSLIAPRLHAEAEIDNSAGDFCVVLGGDQNEASGSAACVVGGYNNGADAEFSVVLGTQNLNNSKPFTVAP